jgi:hypothetical protein
MTKPLSFDDEAVEELESAAEWYETNKEGLGIEFVHTVREALLRIAERPHHSRRARSAPQCEALCFAPLSIRGRVHRAR